MSEALTQSEVAEWADFCRGLFDRIIDARLAGKPVTLSEQPELITASIGPANPNLHVPSGKTFTLITL